MGYYATISPVSFDVKSGVDVKKAWELFKMKASEEQREYLEQYSWEVKEGVAYLEMVDFHAKHYADSLLAEFISNVVEGFCVVEFAGEDGANWGYLVLPGEVKEVEYVKMVDGEILEEFLAPFHKGKPDERMGEATYKVSVDVMVKGGDADFKKFLEEIEMFDKGNERGIRVKVRRVKRLAKRKAKRWLDPVCAEVKEALEKDILSRYSNPEYWDLSAAEDVMEKFFVSEEERVEIMRRLERGGVKG